MRLNEIFSSKAIATRWIDNINNTQPDLGEAFFPLDTKKSGSKITWYEGNTGMANSLMPSSLDAEMTLRQREGWRKIEAELPFWREGFQIKESESQVIEDALNTDDPNAAEIIDKIFNDSLNLIRGAKTAIERMRMGLLFPINGNIGAHISANGVKYDYVYDPSGTWKTTNFLVLTGDDAWAAPNTADPLDIFDNSKTTIKGLTGARIKYAVMNGVTFNLMAATAAVKNRFITTSGIAVANPRKKDIKSMIEQDTEIKIIIHDELYNDESGKPHKYVPDNYVTFLPEGPVGVTRIGRTPEERRMKEDTLDVSVIDGGITIANYETPHPVRYNIFASCTALPSFEGKNDMFTVKVA